MIMISRTIPKDAPKQSEAKMAKKRKKGSRIEEVKTNGKRIGRREWSRRVFDGTANHCGRGSFAPFSAPALPFPAHSVRSKNGRPKISEHADKPRRAARCLRKPVNKRQWTSRAVGFAGFGSFSQPPEGRRVRARYVNSLNAFERSIGWSVDFFDVGCSYSFFDVGLLFRGSWDPAIGFGAGPHFRRIIVPHRPTVGQFEESDAVRCRFPSSLKGNDV